MQVIVNGDIPREEVEYWVADEKRRWQAQGKEIGKIVITDVGDGELEIRAYEKSPIKRIRRITGYLAEVDCWNDAKQAELKDRVAH